MSIEDKHACAELIQAWGLYRDQGRWPELLSTFTPDGEIAVSWFRGPFPVFVDRCKQNAASGSRSKHLLWPSSVRVAGERAVAETNAMILVRQDIGGVLVDLTSVTRFLDRLQKRQDGWRMVERAAIYEQDRLDPVGPSDKYAALMQSADFSKYPAPYRYMAFRVEAAGRTLAEPVHYDGAPHTEALHRRYEAWLKGDCL